MTSKIVQTLLAAAAILPLGVVSMTEAFAQKSAAGSSVAQGSAERVTFEARTQPERRFTHSAGIGVGSEACRDPSYAMDQRCIAN
jgi:hypothetical protein